MNVMTRLLIILLLLVPIVAPANATTPASEAPMSMQHSDVAADHACCEDNEEAKASARPWPNICPVMAVMVTASAFVGQAR